MSHVRCAGCRTRRTLTWFQLHVRPPRCSCGRRKWWIDRYRMQRERGPGTATCIPGRSGCNEYAFPHRKGSGWCIHNPNMPDERRREREGFPDEIPCPF